MIPALILALMDYNLDNINSGATNCSKIRISLPPYCNFTYYMLRDPVTVGLTAYMSRAAPTPLIRNLISFVSNAKWTSNSPNFYLM